MDPTLLAGDIVERDTSSSKPPKINDTPISTTGFPQPRRRWKSSVFKQRRAGDGQGNDAKSQGAEKDKPASAVAQGQDGATGYPDFETVEKRRIDQENRQRVNDMTPEEIAQAQKDIMDGMDPTLIQRLLKRSTIDEESSSPFRPPAPRTQSPPRAPPPEITVDDEDGESEVNAPPPAEPSRAPSKKSGSQIPENYNEDQEPSKPPPDLFPITDQPTTTHFPVAPTLPDLDPSDPNFLATLHEKYFPELPADPSKLAWMAPVPTEDSAADQDSPYYPHAEIAVSALRFDFRGRLLSPRTSRSIPSTKGLHHHGQAPEAAGYTIEEMARLARSAVPAQRCMAYQTLGRILYRLGQGDWGRPQESPVSMGIWAAVKKGRVLESLAEAAMGEGGHRGSRAYATEALWLFEKGGWKETVKSI